ncbi:MAG: hypothetical protein ACYDAJ_02590 [Nitrosotalea sp.]
MTLSELMSDSMKKGLLLLGATLSYAVLERALFDKRKKYLTSEDLKIIYQLKKKPQKKTRQDFANEAFTEFEPLGTGQKILDFRK